MLEFWAISVIDLRSTALGDETVWALEVVAGQKQSVQCFRDVRNSKSYLWSHFFESSKGVVTEF